MSKKVVLSLESLADARQAFLWYESKNAGLGEHFLAEVNACIELIGSNPELFEVAHNNYRRVIVRRFPYAIFYKCAEDTVTIGSIFHHSLNPERLRNRLR